MSLPDGLTCWEKKQVTARVVYSSPKGSCDGTSGGYDPGLTQAGAFRPLRVHEQPLRFGGAAEALPDVPQRQLGRGGVVSVATAAEDLGCLLRGCFRVAGPPAQGQGPDVVQHAGPLVLVTVNGRSVQCLSVRGAGRVVVLLVLVQRTDLPQQDRTQLRQPRGVKQAAGALVDLDRLARVAQPVQQPSPPG